MKKILFFFFFLSAIFFAQKCFAQAIDLKKVKQFSSGDIMSSSNAAGIGGGFAKSQKPYDEMIMAVYSSSVPPDSVQYQKRFQPFKSYGTCEVKYNSENGQIKKGDVLTSSSTPGEAMKATKSGMIIGIALEDASSEKGLIKIRVMVQYVKQ